MSLSPGAADQAAGSGGGDGAAVGASEAAKDCLPPAGSGSRRRHQTQTVEATRKSARRARPSATS